MSTVRRAAGRIFDRMPRSVQVRLLPRVFGFSRHDVPAPIVAPQGSRRLYIAPANFAGAASSWARAAEVVPDIGARNMVPRQAGGFAFPADYEVPAAVYAYSTRWQRSQFRAVSTGFSHVIIEAQRPLFGTLFADDPSDTCATVLAEARALRARGVEVAMLCHGSDIRLPSRHAELEPDSPFTSHPDGQPAYSDTALLEEYASANRSLLSDVGAPVFVSTPDLLIDVPEASWLPLVIPPSWFELNAGAPLVRERPVVVHVPSRAGLKGSELIEATMRRLHDEELITYDRREHVQSAQMPEVYGAADIVLDQFAIGNYGVAAGEAMAAGRLVVSHVSAQVREHVAVLGHGALPIVESRARDLEQTIRGILMNRAHYREIAAEGPPFVTAVHDGRLSRDVLERAFLRP